MFAPGTRLHAHVCRTMRRFGCGVTHRTVGTLFHNHQTHNTRTVASRAARRAICVIGIVVFAQVPRPRGDRSETQQNQRPANTRVNVRLFILDRNTARAVHRRPPLQLLFEQSRDMRISDAAHLSLVLLRAPRAARAQTGRRRMPCRRPRRPPPRRRATSRP